MNHRQLVTGNLSKHYKSEFIFKLVDIMKNYPQLIRWSEDGGSIQISEGDISQIRREVLPHYFRHSKFESFIRQLHLYNFRQRKEIKSKMVFQHESFRRGNQAEFRLIQRTKNKKEKLQLLKQLQNNDILKSINKCEWLDEEQKSILGVVYSFKLVVVEKHRSLRQKLSQLGEILKSNRNKKVGEIETVLEDEIKLQLESLKKFSKSIDLFLTGTLQQRGRQLNGRKAQNRQKKQQFLRVIEQENQQKSSMQNQNYPKSSISGPQCRSNTYCADYAVMEQRGNTQRESSQFQTHPYVIQLSGDSISSTDNRLFDYHVFFNPHQQQIQQQTNISAMHVDQMNNQSQLSMSLQLLGYPKQQSLMFMPLGFYNKSTVSEFFDWPKKLTPQNIVQKNNINQLGDKNQNDRDKQVNVSFKRKSEQFETSGKTVGSKDRHRRVQDDMDESEISFMNDDE